MLSVISLCHIFAYTYCIYIYIAGFSLFLNKLPLIVDLVGCCPLVAKIPQEDTEPTDTSLHSVASYYRWRPRMWFFRSWLLTSAEEGEMLMADIATSKRCTQRHCCMTQTAIIVTVHTETDHLTRTAAPCDILPSWTALL